MSEHITFNLTDVELQEAIVAVRNVTNGQDCPDKRLLQLGDMLSNQKDRARVFRIWSRAREDDLRNKFSEYLKATQDGSFDTAEIVGYDQFCEREFNKLPAGRAILLSIGHGDFDACQTAEEILDTAKELADGFDLDSRLEVRFISEKDGRVYKPTILIDLAECDPPNV